MWKEIFHLKKTPAIECFTDNKSLVEMLHTTKIISDMRLRVDVSKLREMVIIGEIKVDWVEGRNQLADTLTKRGASSDKLLKALETAQLQ